MFLRLRSTVPQAVGIINLIGRHIKISGACVYFSNICRNLTALGVRNALQSVESSIQGHFSRFLYMPPWYIHCITRTAHQNVEEPLSLPYIWHKDKRASPERLGTCVCAASAINNNCVLRQL